MRCPRHYWAAAAVLVDGSIWRKGRGAGPLLPRALPHAPSAHAQLWRTSSGPVGRLVATLGCPSSAD
eukprot:scaffold202210_cov32-Tisochrysis_lutea.AAC.6